MQNFKKLIIVVFIATIVSESFAQTLGIRAGLNLSNILSKNDDDIYSDNFKMNPGFHIGAVVEFPITEIFSFETGLLLSTKGYKNNEGATILTETIEYKSRLNLLYVDIPITSKIFFNLGDAKIYCTLGPYFGVGLIGRYNIEVTIMGETEINDKDIQWGSDEENDDMKRLDFGLTAGAGVEINTIQVGLFYGLGLANISTNTDRGSIANNRILGISVGFKFSRK